VIKSRRVRRVGLVAHRGEIRNAYKILVGKPDWKKLLGKPRHSWKDNIRMDLREIGRECVDWMNLVWDRDQPQALVNMVMNLQVP
jgi:uncharacterized short protein YbdD (DUF466 family)